MDTSIYDQLDILYQESQKRKRFFRGNKGTFRLLEPVEIVRKYNRGNKLVYWDDEKHTDKSLMRKWVRFEIEIDGEILHWDVRDHHLNKVKPLVGKEITFMIVNKGNWRKSIMEISEIKSIDEPPEQNTIEEPVKVPRKKPNNMNLCGLLDRCYNNREFVESLSNNTIQKLLSTFSNTDKLNDRQKLSIRIIRSVKREKV